VRFTELEPPGVWLVDLELIQDDRGFFARSWSPDEFAQRGLDPGLAQCSVSYNQRRGTLRGLHYQVAPHAEAKLVRCTAGEIFDVAVDLRPGSPSRGRWTAVELTASNRRALYIPAGFAHGFQSLSDGSEVLYQVSTGYSPEHSRGIRWDDPEVGIEWPLKEPVLSPRDHALPTLAAAEGL
jgi:dTDP-4-dehydrorhamnose 3,5-epimerase